MGRLPTALRFVGDGSVGTWLAATYNATVSTPARLRTREEIAALCARTELVPPGLERATDWKPPAGWTPDRSDPAAAVLLGAVARIP